MTFTPFFVALHATDDLEERKKLDYAFSTLSVSETKMTLFNNVVTLNATTRQLFIKCASQLSFKMEQNRHGEWFLRAFRKSPRSPFKDSSLSLMDSNWLAKNISAGEVSERFYDELENMVMRTDPELLKLKEYSANWYSGHTFETMLAFPFLRNYTLEVSPSRPPLANLLGFSHGLHDTALSLISLNSEGIPLHKGLRQANSLAEFFSDVSKNNRSMFRSERDYESMCRVNATWLFLTWRLGVPAEFLNTMMPKQDEPKTRNISIPRTYIDQFKVILKRLNVDEIRLIKNMFRYLPTDSLRSFAFTSIIKQRVPYAAQKASFNYKRYQQEIDWRKIPMDKRTTLACEMLDVISGKNEDYKLFEDGLTLFFSHWFAKNVTPELLTSSFSKYHELKSLLAEQLDVDITKSECFKIETVGDVSFLAKNYSGMLKALNPRALKWNYNFFNLIYDTQSNSYVEISGILVSEVLEEAKKRLNSVDQHLLRIGRALTPENRCLFLQVPSNMSKHKNFWKYVDYGVRDCNRITALKKIKAGKRASVEFNNLPDDMFYEFVLDLSVDEFMEQFGQHLNVAADDVQLNADVALMVRPKKGVPF